MANNQADNAMDYQDLLYEKQRNGVLITLNRPEVMNAISDELDVELHHALDAADADPEVRAIVLTGAGAGLLRGIRYCRWRRGLRLALWPAGRLQHRCGDRPMAHAVLEERAWPHRSHYR